MKNDFIFDGQRLSDFGYIIVDFNSTGVTTSNVSKMSYTDVKAPLSHKSHNVSTTYNENLSKQLQIIKNHCTEKDIEISNDELSRLSRWLCRTDYKQFKWIDDKDDDEIFYNVKIDLSKLELGNVIGFELNITADTQFGYTREIKNVMDFTDTTENIVNVYSDDEGIIYPDVVITIKEDGDLKLINDKESNRSTIINDCKTNEIITIIGGDTLQITSSLESRNFSDNIFNYKFPRLISKYRDYHNIFTSSLKCTMEIKYRGIRKVGM